MPGTFSNDYTTLHSCDSTDGENTGTIASDQGSCINIQTSSGNGNFNEKQGTDCVEFEYNGDNTWHSLRVVIDSGQEFDLTQNNLLIWFFYVAGKGTAYLDPTDSLRIAVTDENTTWSSVSDYGEFYIGGNNDLPTGWFLISVSGDSDDVDNETATAPDYTSIKTIWVRMDAQNDNNDSGESPMAIDYYRYGTGISFYGGTSGSPVTSTDIDTYAGFNTAHGVWDARQANGSFIDKRCKVTVGDGTNSTYFQDDSLFIFENMLSDDVKHGWEIEAQATLHLGEKVSGTGYEFGSSGCQIVSSLKGSVFNESDLVVSGTNSTLYFYGCLIRGFDDILLGESGTSAGTIELSDTEFSDCRDIELRTTNTDMLNVKVHDSPGSYGLKIYSTPSNMEAVSVYNNDYDGIFFDTSTSLTNFEDFKVINNDDGVEFDTAATYTLDNWNFSANTYDIHNSSTGQVIISATNGSNPGTYDYKNTGNTFDTGCCVSYNANTTTYTDEVTDINDTGTNDVALPPIQATTAGDAIYFGDNAVFTGVTLNLGTAGVYSNITITWQYYNGSWTEITDVVDNSSGFSATAGTYTINFRDPIDNADWTTVSVNGTSAYWIRAVTSWTSGQSLTTAPLGTQGWHGYTRIDNNVTLEINGVVQNTQCYIISNTDSTVLMNEAASTQVGSTNEYKATEDFNYSASTGVTIRTREMGYLPFETTGTITSSGLTVAAVWLVDPNWKLVVSGVNITFTNPTTITRASGNFTTDGWLTVMGQVTVDGSTNNDGTYTLSAVGTTTITITGATLTNEGPTSGVTLTFTRREPDW